MAWRVGDPREFYFWRFDKCTLESSAAAGAGLEFFIGGEFLIFLSLWRPSGTSGSNYFRTKLILIVRKGGKDMEWRLTSIYHVSQVINIHTLRFLVHTYLETHAYHCLSEIMPCWDYLIMKSIISYCRSLFEVNFFTDQVRPALGSVGCLVGQLSPCSGSHIYRHICLIHKWIIKKPIKRAPWHNGIPSTSLLSSSGSPRAPLGPPSTPLDPCVVPYMSSEDPSEAVNPMGHHRPPPWPPGTPLTYPLNPLGPNAMDVPLLGPLGPLAPRQLKHSTLSRVCCAFGTVYDENHTNLKSRR